MIEKDKGSMHPTHFPLVMSAMEREYLENAFKTHNQIVGGGGGEYLEFGSGGSTFLALLHSNMRITSVESDKKWLAHLSEWDMIKQNLSTQRLSFFHVDIGKTGAWGVPLELNKRESFPNYSKQIFTHRNDFSMVFVDGRFRVACILASIIYCKANTRILVHDFNNRPHYHKVVEFLDFVDTCDTLAEFKIKENIDPQRLLAMYDKSRYDYE